MKTDELNSFLEIFNVELPDSMLRKIKVLFTDNDDSNWNVDNLDYCFQDGPLECPFYPGYYYVPGFSRYAINVDGELVRIKTGRRIKWGKTKGNVKSNITGGYFVTSLLSDRNKKRIGVKRHRLLCLTFKHPETPVKRLVVNHKDGVPGHDELDNIVFCTYSENTKHAYDTGLHSNKTVSVVLLNWKTEEAHVCDTLTQASEITGINYQTLSGRLKRHNGNLYSDGWRIRYLKDDWKPLKSRIGESSQMVDVVIRNVFTDETFLFSSISDASNHTGVSGGSIQTHLELEPFHPLHGWNFRKLSSFDDWPEYSDNHLRIFKDRPNRVGDGIEVFDRNENTTLFFTSAQAAGEYFDISPITAIKLARYNDVQKKRYEFRLFKAKEPTRPPDA